ncbi:MAG: hypothetical protein JSU88_08665 [Nitrospinaceae bacterium]|nr:MAG: hypothetical protein JSU88_08665 [Nitrospinaceae bacterium]
MTLDGEITEITSPPNKADQFRSVTIWLPESEEHVELTLGLEEFKKSGMVIDDKITIKIDKKFDIDSLTQNLLKID